MQASPLAPPNFPQVLAISGLKIATAAAGIKYKDREDIAIFSLPENSSVAAVFTQSKTASAAVHWSQQQLKNSSIRGFVVNSGNANAFTGANGDKSNVLMADMAAEIIGCQKEQILTASTGVIGVPLNDTAVSAAKQTLQQRFAEEDANAPLNYEKAAKAIMTTDTFAKASSVKAKVNDKEVMITGIAKGSGMIAPDMATMLGFIFTDANIEQSLLQTILQEINKQTFNCITVDSDTSTSDSLFLAATAQKDEHQVTKLEECVDFIIALTELMRDLATQIVKDGEGASKFITISLSGASSDDAAKKVAMSIANSPLVKTAIAGEDANWGRIVAAIGKAGEQADRDKIIISMGGINICADGQAVKDYDETKVSQHLQGESIRIDVDLQIGKGFSRVWTCDLTERYIQINADYRS